MPVLDLDGRALSWREAGHGAPAILFHCSLAHSGALSGLMAGLGDRLKMRAPDLPGHGGTGLDPRGPHRDQALEDARRMLPATGPAHLIGHSYGATVALRLALADPGRVVSLTLIEPVQFSLLAEEDPAGFAAEMAAQAPFLDAAAAGDWPAAARLFLGRWGGAPAGTDPERTAYMLARIPLVAAENVILNDPDHSGVRARDLSRLTCPVLLVAGAQSPPVAHQILDVIANRLPAARRLTLQGAGHMAPLTHPRPIAAAIAELVAASLPRQGPSFIPGPIREVTMERLTARDFPELLELYDYYAHGRITKREFLDRAARYAVGGLTAAALLAQMRPNYALAAQVSLDDPDIVAETITYASPEGHGEVSGYFVRPAGVAKAPGVVVVHENRGLNPYIADVARRVAKAGFVALAPDGLSSVGGYPGDDDAGRELQAKVDPEKLMNDFLAAVTTLMDHEATTGRVGITGFCYGGGVANAAAVAIPELGAAVPFYGRQARAEDVPRINAPILLHYAELDTRINEGWPVYEAALKAAGKVYEAHIYPGVNHGFHNDTTPRYDEAAATLAWDRTIGWFRRYLA